MQQPDMPLESLSVDSGDGDKLWLVTFSGRDNDSHDCHNLKYSP